MTGLIDWDNAGPGDPGVDLGSLRCDAAICYGTQAITDVLQGWEHAAGRGGRGRTVLGRGCGAGHPARHWLTRRTAVI